MNWTSMEAERSLHHFSKISQGICGAHAATKGTGQTALKCSLIWVFAIAECTNDHFFLFWLIWIELQFVFLPSSENSYVNVYNKFYINVFNLTTRFEYFTAYYKNIIHCKYIFSSCKSDLGTFFQALYIPNKFTKFRRNTLIHHKIKHLLTLSVLIQLSLIKALLIAQDQGR